jgi:hypothetical protein
VVLRLGDDHPALLVEIDTGRGVHALSGRRPQSDSRGDHHHDDQDREADLRAVLQDMSLPRRSDDCEHDDSADRDEHRERNRVGKDVQVRG